MSRFSKAREDADEITEALDLVYGPDGEEAELDPVLVALQWLSLPPEEW